MLPLRAQMDKQGHKEAAAVFVLQGVQLVASSALAARGFAQVKEIQLTQGKVALENAVRHLQNEIRELRSLQTIVLEPVNG
jgi:hypothetical protein